VSAPVQAAQLVYVTMCPRQPICAEINTNQPLPAAAACSRDVCINSLLLINLFYLQHSHCTLNCTQGFNGWETPWMSYDATNPPIWHP